MIGWESLKERLVEQQKEMQKMAAFVSVREVAGARGMMVAQCLIEYQKLIAMAALHTVAKFVTVVVPHKFTKTTAAMQDLLFNIYAWRNNKFTSIPTITPIPYA